MLTAVCGRRRGKQRAPVARETKLHVESRQRKVAKHGVHVAELRFLGALELAPRRSVEEQIAHLHRGAERPCRGARRAELAAVADDLPSARFSGGELWLYNLHISPYEAGNRHNHDPLRPRKLLLHRREMRRLVGEAEQEGLTLVPLDIYFRGGIAKTTLALVRGKKLHDKREDLKTREVKREMDRAYKLS